MKKALACFKAGLSGQPMPANADRTTGKVVAIASGVGGVVAIGTFFLGYGIRAMKAGSDAQAPPQ